MGNINIHGYSVSFDDASRECVNHLINSDYAQAKALFDKAVANGSTTFEWEGGGYKLAWTGSGSYTISKKY